MLDLDALAKRRAAKLNETEEAWKKAIWGRDFQTLAADMSDGEVESFVEACASVTEFESLIADRIKSQAGPKT